MTCTGVAPCLSSGLAKNDQVLYMFVLLSLLLWPFDRVTSTQYMDFLEIFNISLDLSSVHFAHFSGC